MIIIIANISLSNNKHAWNDRKSKEIMLHCHNKCAKITKEIAMQIVKISNIIIAIWVAGPYAQSAWWKMHFVKVVVMIMHCRINENEVNFQCAKC